MTHTDWERFGRAAEHLARRVARDARKFAARVEEHVGEFAGELGREWRSRTDAGRGGDAAAEVRRVFDDIRGVLAAVLEGVDEVITDVFAGATDEPWTRVVCNGERPCEACGRTIASGGDAWVRRRAGGRRFRCAGCGVPADEARPT